MKNAREVTVHAEIRRGSPEKVRPVRGVTGRCIFFRSEQSGEPAGDTGLRPPGFFNPAGEDYPFDA
jgi:hypothetical protein